MRSVGVTENEVDAAAVLVYRLLEEVQPWAVLLVAEIVDENPVNEKAGLFVPVVLLPKRLSTTLVVETGGVYFTRSVPSFVRVLVSQASS